MSMNGTDELHHFNRHKNMFFPLFCRLSIKDIITLNSSNNHHHRKTPISAPASPSSPKVSCMGQVKRNNRIVGFPPVAHHNRHSKLRNLFSTNKTLFPPTAPIKSDANASGRCRSKSLKKLNFKKNECDKQEDRVEVLVDIGEIDPPLPVVKRVGVGRDEVNLWRRRSNGAVALKGLQIEQSIITRLPISHHSIITNISQRPTQTV